MVRGRAGRRRWLALAGAGASALLAAAGSGCAKKIPPPHPEAEHHNEECAQLLHDGDLEQARQHCLEALEYSPQYAAALLNLAVIQLKSDQKPAARDTFLKALALDEKLPEAHNDLGVLAMEERNFEDAEKRFKRALELSPDHVPARYNLALDYYLWKKNPKAREQLARLMGAHPELSDPMHFDAILRLEEGRLEDAIARFVQCVTMRPEMPGYWLALGVGLGRAHRYKEAEDAFQTCLELDPGDPVCRDDLKALIARKPLPPP
ncbi:MAG TPA: tetratricopeptide repeat protein, partial [Myxococcaceae bacterium]